ncbi:hypothetical protein [Hydrogenophaga sp.]|uniref:hypothetical protein n=1 Tax=Hydrogenophaga sp. TaxID=1904254 RepID=UPI003D0FEF47
MSDLLESELRLEQHIKDCGERMAAAFKAGDRKEACEWQGRMYTAIRSRTPEHQARLSARIDSAIWFQSEEALEMGRVPPDA